MPVDPLTIAGIAAPLVASGANAYAQGKTNRKTRKHNEHMYEKQLTDNIRLWNMQNDYNSPEAQMERLKKAGLNPNLVYGDGATATSKSAPAGAEFKPWNPDAPQLDPRAIGDMVGSYYDTRLKQVQTNNLKAQEEVIHKEAALKDAQTIATLKNAGYTDEQIKALQQEIEFKQKLNPISLEAAAVGVDKSIHEIQKLRVDMDYTRDQNVRATVQLIDHLKTTKLGRTKTQEEIAEIAQKIKNLKTEGKIKEFEAFLNSLGLTPGDNQFLRRLEIAGSQSEEAKKYRPSGSQHSPGQKRAGEAGRAAGRAFRKN